jgi:hypothetical protein
MDLNELFYRQQIARSMADSASSDVVRREQDALAKKYEMQIAQAKEARPLFDCRFPRTNVFGATKVNSTVAVAMTAREVGTN